MSRRAFLGTGVAAAALVPGGCAWRAPAANGIAVNDVHSKLNPARVARLVQPVDAEGVQRAIEAARAEGRAVSVAGGRHAMGGQQFGEDTVLLDMRAMNRVRRLDAGAGLVEVDGGIEWPELIGFLVRAQAGRTPAWAIAQKQTGADRLTIGGALAANIHGRGLVYRPFVQDVEAFTLIDHRGAAVRVSRGENAELFRLAIGGYGLLGVVVSVTLRLVPRRKLERVVRVMDVEELMPAFERRIAEGYLYGDFQYATDPASEGLLRTGVFSCYRPVDDARPVPEAQKELAVEDWQRLFHLSHTNKARAFETYADYYLATSGQRYWSDTAQLSVYIDDYHEALDRQLGDGARASEMIGELYVPRRHLVAFLDGVREDVRRHRVDLIYGTIRLIERDGETVLAWAREPWACVIVNVHTVHTPEGLERSAAAFRRFIDRALAHGGSYFLTYHRWAERRQVESSHPRLVEFLRSKRRHDPDERFQSDWYRHYRAMFAAELAGG